MNIVIIEDEILILKALSKILQKQGHHITSFVSGVDAIDYLKLNKPDRIVCDLMLQDISGFDILEEARQYFKQDELKEKFIIMTAYSSEHVLSKIKDYGCHVLRKPFQNMSEALNIIVGGHK